MMRLLLRIRQVIFSDFFCEAGVKNEATDLPEAPLQLECSLILASGDLCSHLLVVVDSIFLFTGGGEMDARAGEAALFMLPAPAILKTWKLRMVKRFRKASLVLTDGGVRQWFQAKGEAS